MKTKNIFLALLCLLLAFSACKEHIEDEIKYPGPRIKKTSVYMNGQLSFETTYHYDATGRIIREDISDNYYIQYSYLPGKLTMKAFLPDEEDIPADTMLLNGKGLQISDFPSTTIEYDAYGYLEKMTLLINKVPNSHTFQIENGNTVHWTLRIGNHLENIVNDQAYEFLPNSTNTIGYENMGMPFYGKQNENLLAKTTYISHSANSTYVYESSETYEYLLDARNRVTKKSTVENQGNYSLYTYYE